MKVEILTAAESEFIESILYLNKQHEGLGDEFAMEIKRTITRIICFPNAWTKLSSRTHRCRTKRFPYAIIYQVRGEIILIVAIMHLRRRPDLWKSRV